MPCGGTDLKILDAKAAGTVEGGPTYSLKNRAFRGFWSLTWFFLAAWTPPPANRWRLFLLSLFGAKIAPEAFVYGSARVWYPPHFEAGRYARSRPLSPFIASQKSRLRIMRSSRKARLSAQPATTFKIHTFRPWHSRSP